MCRFPHCRILVHQFFDLKSVYLEGYSTTATHGQTVVVEKRGKNSTRTVNICLHFFTARIEKLKIFKLNVDIPATKLEQLMSGNDTALF